jgi:hypothetical protein
MSRQSDYVTEARQAARQVWGGINALVALQREWDALDYGNTLADGAGANSGVTRAHVGACVFDSANALVTALNGGVATNFARLL